MAIRETSYRLIIALPLALIAAAAVGAWGGTICPEIQRPFPAQASEVADIISKWLTDRGFALHREFSRPGHIHLTAWNPRNSWDITVTPRSALASAARMIHDGEESSGQACRRLQGYIEGYLAGTPPAPVAQPPGHRSTVPTVVLDKLDTVVCLHAQSARQTIQFSGFVVDPNGLVLCTAHDLIDRQGVTVTFYDGTQVPGRIAQLDTERDLALVECSGSGLAFVPLATGRNLLGMGERVFSIGCPNNLEGVMAPGVISGPPRLVNDQPLWQVEMDIYPGSSGSPVFDDRGHIVAMVKGRYRGTSAVGFLTPLETIIAFLLDLKPR